MHQNLDRKTYIKRLLKLVATVAAVLLGVFLVYKLSYFIAPFLIAFLIASLLEPVVRFMVRKMKISRKVAAPVVLLVFIAGFGVLLILAILRIINEIKSFSNMLPRIFNDIYANAMFLIDKASDAYDQWLPPEVTYNIESIITNITSSLINMAKSFASTLVKGAFSTAFSIPEIVIFIAVTILSTYFLMSDRDKIFKYFKTHFPDKWVSKVTSFKNDTFSALFRYLKAQLIIMTITFAELFIGLSIIRVKYALILAFVISIIDILPILGTGTILIPWSLYNFLTGDIRMGVSLIILYVIILIVRQMIEPKIVGYQLGLYPLLTLMAMYIGLKLIGVLGLILGPIAFLLVKNILMGIFKNRSVREILSNPVPRQNNSNGKKD
jgi:sporulation integral membrane protein YtvI